MTIPDAIHDGLSLHRCVLRYSNNGLVLSTNFTGYSGLESNVFDEDFRCHNDFSRRLLPIIKNPKIVV